MYGYMNLQPKYAYFVTSISKLIISKLVSQNNWYLRHAELDILPYNSIKLILVTITEIVTIILEDEVLNKLVVQGQINYTYKQQQ